jgi:hypothetical protein
VTHSTCPIAALANALAATSPHHPSRVTSDADIVDDCDHPTIDGHGCYSKRTARPGVTAFTKVDIEASRYNRIQIRELEFR